MAQQQGRLLSREDILKAEDVRTERVHVPEWGGDVLVRQMTGDQRDAWEDWLILKRPAGRSGPMVPTGIRARFLSLVLVDETGEPLFSPDDIEGLGRKSAAALDRVYEVAERLNKLAAQDLEDLQGNSGAGRSAGTGSASP